MDSIRRRHDVAATRPRILASTPPLTMALLLSEIGDHPIPDDLRSEIEGLEGNWGRSLHAEAWVVNACIRAEKKDLLAAMLNKHGVERLLGIRRGAGIVVHLLAACSSLAHIEFSRATISDEEARALAHALQGHPRLSSLGFRDCEMSNAALSAVVTGLPQMLYLQTVRIEARSGTWLDTLGAAIAVHATLTSLVLQVPNLRTDRASKLGRSLQGNCTLTMLEVQVASPDALTALLKGLACTEGSGFDGGSLCAAERPFALPRLACIDLRSDARLDDAFCAALSEWIGTRKALASIRIQAGVDADEESIATLCSAIERSAVKIDFDADTVPEPLARLAKFRPYQQLLLSADAAVAVARPLLKSLPGWSTLPRELKAKIRSYLFGNGLPRDLRLLRSLMSLSKEMRRAAVGIRSATHGERFAATMGRRDLPHEPDLDAFIHYWRLQFSGIDLGESAALMQPEWRLPSEESSELSRDQRVFRDKLAEVGEQLVRKQLGWVSRWIEDGNSDPADFVLTAAQRLTKEHGFYLDSEVAPLSRRLALGEVRHHRRMACAHLARWMFMTTLVLVCADHFCDVAMRQLFDEDRAHGIGPVRSLDEARAQRGVVASWIVWPLVAVIAIFMLKVEWVDAIARKLRLPQP